MRENEVKIYFVGLNNFFFLNQKCIEEIQDILTIDYWYERRYSQGQATNWKLLRRNGHLIDFISFSTQ